MDTQEWWLTTDRLGLRRFTARDLDFLADLYADPEVTRHLGGTRDRAQTEDLLNTRILDYYEANPGLGIWMTIERATGQRVGFHLLNHIQGERIVQVGFTLGILPNVKHAGQLRRYFVSISYKWPQEC